MTARLPLTPAAVDRIRLVGARLIDGTGGAPVDDAEIVVAGDRIAWAGPRRGDVAEERDTRIVDLRGATVLPGFFDTHVHLALDLEADPRQTLAQFPSERALDAAATMRKTLMAGITTARDLSGLDAGYRAAVAAGTILGPRLHLAIQALSPTGGHTDFRLPNGASVHPGPEPEISPIIDSDDDVRRAVRALVRSGADVVKVCTTGGVSSPSDSPHDLGVPERHVRLIVEETARRQGQPVAAHAQGAAGIKEAIRGGVASVEHGYEIDDEGIDLMLEHGTVLVPTLSSALRVPDPARVPGYLYEKKVRWSQIAREHVARAIQSGVTVALGTDAAVCPHGRNLLELGHLVDLGLSPMAAIQAGTINAARLLRLDEHLGTVEAGKLADLVITAVDPLAGIHALADPVSIDAIVQGGRVVKDALRRFPGGVATTSLG
ncbi:metal-dependent hydrolase family protein [Microbacterium ulmi]|uniref:Amidohydrolase family protein n=1 Tax=Microbacterium ulmi TaxID=179095 RepID=A0A7Y2M1M4_9MICO|nr:amidohydrolase family protein [Microbacterium ulmi]NII70237.1 imidazolonepropionase-like amidohydrolase [Microbacterium ulmi]NNH04502.1 amidohydrolase family protein [Microbacterium ulmi]